MAIKITADSTCDLSAEQLRQHNIDLFPMSITMGDQCLRDGIDVTPDDIYSHVDAGGDICTTSALNIADYTDRFSAFSKDYDAVIHINISAEFSSCYQNAVLAAQEFDNVYVVDSRNLSTGHGLVVVEAALAARRGMAPDELVSFLRELTGRVEASFLIDRLDYMVKGGRCSAVAMLGANLLRLKPCIEVKDGKMGVVKKYRGAFAKCLVDYVRERLEGRTDLVPDRVFITHTTVAPEIVAAVRQAVEQYGPFAEILETDAGCTVSSHCGPGTLGILFIRKA